MKKMDWGDDDGLNGDCVKGIIIEHQPDADCRWIAESTPIDPPERKIRRGAATGMATGK